MLPQSTIFAVDYSRRLFPLPFKVDDANEVRILTDYIKAA